VRDRVRWNDDGTDVVVLSKTDETGTTYVDKTKTLAHLVDDVYRDRPFLFEPSGRKGAGTELGPGEPAPSNPFAQTTDGFRERIKKMKSR